MKDILLKETAVTFRGVDPEEDYFAMVSAAYDQAFFSLPPCPIRPAPLPIQSKPSSASQSPTQASLSTPSKANSLENHSFDEDSYGVSDDEDFGGNMALDEGSPAPSSLRQSPEALRPWEARNTGTRSLVSKKHCHHNKLDLSANY